MDIRQAITDRIIGMMEKGGSTWAQSWSSAARSGMPTNARTGTRYSGINVLLLLGAAAEAGFASNKWLTFKQAADLGAKVRKGEKGVACCFFEMVKTKKQEAKGEEEQGAFPMCKPFWLFNVAQIDGLPSEMAEAATSARHEFHAVNAAERIAYACGATIEHGGERAFFRPATDSIGMPHKERFKTPENYYATLMHELTHWTGAVGRLNRTFGKRFGDDAYAFEELVAELGAAFVMGHLGLVETTIEGHAGYLELWLKVLREDKTAIFSAAKHAGQAYEYLVTRADLVAQEA